MRATILFIIITINEPLIDRSFKESQSMETAWIIVPVMILIAIVMPSLRLLYFCDVDENRQLTVKAVGHQ